MVREEDRRWVLVGPRQRRLYLESIRRAPRDEKAQALELVGPPIDIWASAHTIPTVHSGSLPHSASSTIRPTFMISFVQGRSKFTSLTSTISPLTQFISSRNPNPFRQMH